MTLDEEFGDVLESMIVMARDAEHEVNVALHRDEKASAVALQYANRLQDIMNFAGQRFPSEWKVQP